MRTPKLIALAALVPALAPAALQAQAPPPPATPPAPPLIRIRQRASKDGRIITPSPEFLERVNQFYNLDFGPVGEQTRVNLNLDNATVADAVKQVCEQANLPYKVDQDVPEDMRITVRANNVQLSTALGLISEAAGVGWGYDVQGDKRSIHVGKSAKMGILNLRMGNGPVSLGLAPGFMSIAPPSIGKLLPPDVKAVNPQFGYSILLDPEERSTFNCPHCKGQTTMVRVRQQPKCTQCSRTFQPDWQFCPADGSKRPAAPNEWRHCPLCGKEVQREKSDRRGAPFLQELPVIGRVFETPEPGDAEPVAPAR